MQHIRKVRTFAVQLDQKSPVTMRHTRELNRVLTQKLKKDMNKKETIKFIVQLIAAVASAILTALGASSCIGA